MLETELLAGVIKRVSKRRSRLLFLNKWLS